METMDFVMDIHPSYEYPYPHNLTNSVDIHLCVDINPTPSISMRTCINKILYMDFHAALHEQILWTTMYLWISIMSMDIYANFYQQILSTTTSL